MDLDLLKRNWEAFGRDDPLWAVLTDPSRKGGRWDLDEFLATGEREVAELFDELDGLGISVSRGRALDFGCGVGRLTQALADRFDACDGVDIAASMIREARRLNRDPERVRYHVNAAADLTLFAGESFDFALSFIALQHMEPRYSKRYIAEFIRVLKPGAVAVFQLPTGRSQSPPPPPAPPIAQSAPSEPARAGNAAEPGPGRPPEPVMEMYGTAPEEVEATLTAAGARIEHRFADARGGPGVESYRYIVRRVTEHAVPLPRPSLGYLEAAIAAIPDRPDMFPPLITRRSGRVAEIELSVRRSLTRALRSVTWVQTQYDREVLRALQEARGALQEQDAELRRLDQELAHLRRAPRDDPSPAPDPLSRETLLDESAPTTGKLPVMATEILAADTLSEAMRALASGAGGPLGGLWSQRISRHLQDTYAGIPISKFPEDLRTYELILWERAPTVVIEVGVQHGGSTLWLRDRLFDFQRYRAGPAPRVVAVDVDLEPARRTFAALPAEAVAGIELVEGDITQPGVADEILSLTTPDAEVFVIEDAQHDADTTSAALRVLAPLIRAGGYFMVEDTCVDYELLRVREDWPRGCASALARWLDEDALGRRFERRPELQAYGLTCHPGGLVQRLADP